MRLCWDNRRAPNKEADLLDLYTTALRCKNKNEVVTVGAILTPEQCIDNNPTNGSTEEPYEEVVVGSNQARFMCVWVV